MTGASRQKAPNDEVEYRQVTLTSRDIEDASRLLKLLTRQDGSLVVEPRRAPSSSNDPIRRALIEAARNALNDRRRRVRLFGKAMFREAAWEMLLTLYVEHQNQRLTIAQLTCESGAPATTALRWIDYLENRRLVWRQSHPTDARAVFVELTEQAVASLDLYFSQTVLPTR